MRQGTHTSFVTRVVASIVETDERMVLDWISQGFLKAYPSGGLWRVPAVELPVARALAEGKSPEEARATVQDIYDRLRKRDEPWLGETSASADPSRPLAPSPSHVLSTERVDGELTGPGLYVGRCLCGWESMPRSQVLVRELFEVHIS